MSKVKADEARERGNDCMKKGRHTEAFFYYTDAIKLMPSDYRAYSNRSLAFLKIEQHFHALEDAKKAIQIQPSWPKGYFRKGEVEFSTGHYEEAVTSYEKALSLDENDPKLKEALEKAKEEVKKMKSDAIKIPLIAIGIGLLIGVVIALGDHYLTSKPSLEGYVKLLFLAVFGFFGYGGSWVYFYVITTYREAMIQPPTDLTGGDKKDKAKNSEAVASQGARQTKTTSGKASSSRPSGEPRQRKKPAKT